MIDSSGTTSGDGYKNYKDFETTSDSMEYEYLLDDNLDILQSVQKFDSEIQTDQQKKIVKKEKIS